MVVVLNRSSSSFRAEYLSPAGADWGAGPGPGLTFLVVGGRVLEGWGAGRGSETLLVLTRGLLVLLLTTTIRGLVSVSVSV